MHLKMMTSMGGPDLSIANGEEIPFDESFPFSAAEVHRFRTAEIAELGGAADEIAAWLKANPAPVEATIADHAADTAKADAEASKGAHEPEAGPAATPDAKPAAAKAAAKKG